MAETRVRKVDGLLWAHPCARPGFIPANRPTAAANRAGLAFEASVAASLPGSIHGQWFHFADSRGEAWCQPDIIQFVGSYARVLECKLTWTPVAAIQLRDLYLPIVAKVYNLPTKGLVVCRNLTSKAPPASLDLAGSMVTGLWHRPWGDLPARISPLALATRSLQRKLGISAHG